MARARLPSGGFAIALTVFHTISTIACVLAIGAAAYSAATNKSRSAVATIGAFVAAFWTIGVDGAELAALFFKGVVRRCPPGWLPLLELATAIFCFGLPAASMLGYDAVEYERCRWYGSREESRKMGCSDPGQSMDAAMMAGLGALYLAGTIHSILLVMTTVHWFVKRRSRARKAATVAEKGQGELPACEGVLAPPPKAVVRG